MNGHRADEYNILKVHDVGDCDVDIQDFGDGLGTGNIILWVSSGDRRLWNFFEKKQDFGTSVGFKN